MKRIYKIAEAFNGGKAFIPFITAGFPSLDITEKIVKAAADAGADLIELGIPFSDPTAEGPVIQGANIKALEAGATTDKIFETVKNIRREVSIPLVFMTYANVVYSYGADRFFQACEEVYINGIILADVPFEEKGDFEEAAAAHNVDFISMIAPTSENRIAKIAKEAKGFIYIVSSLGVTGVRSEITTDIDSIVKIVKANTNTPCAVGFGISTPEQAKRMTRTADGAIVGSAIIKIIDEAVKKVSAGEGLYTDGTDETAENPSEGAKAADAVYEYVKSMKDAIRME